VRVLLVEENKVDALAIQRELAGRFELRVAGSLGDALTMLGQASWRPELVLANLKLPDSDGLTTLLRLQHAAAGIPVLLSTGALTDTLRRQLDALEAAAQHERQNGAGMLRQAAFAPQGAYQHSAIYRLDQMAEVDRIARQAADSAVSRTIDQLLDRLGLEDEEGLRMAIRLARGWEAAKLRFISAVATGLGSALLLAIGAGLVAMLRQGGSK
jgi:CheY-like chemotaxis protein